MLFSFSASKCPPLPTVEHASGNQLAGEGLNYGTVIRYISIYSSIYLSIYLSIFYLYDSPEGAHGRPPDLVLGFNSKSFLTYYLSI